MTALGGGTNKRIDDGRWRKYARLINEGHSQRTSAQMAGISYSSVMRQMRVPTSRLNRILGEFGHEKAGVFGIDKVKGDSARALEDFGYFRSRYFARSTSPWAEEAVYKMMELAASPHKEYVVVNQPPGVGKSTLWTHDFPVWLAVRDRSRRTMIGSRTANQAIKYTGRIRRTFERMTPMKADPVLLEKGLAVDAVSTLITDFGRFKPANSDLWRLEEFILAQDGGVAVDDKEANFAAFGMDSGFLGGRYDTVIWDDLVDKTNIRTAESKENLINWWETEAETRLDPGGLLILNGQRMASDDLYRYALNLVDWSEEFEDQPEKAPKKYHHIIYKAHYDELCTADKTNGGHKGNYPDGCLLDEIRLPWRELARVQKNRLDRYRILYQQEDVDQASSLIQPAWIDGGMDSTGASYQGCWDENRNIGKWPENIHAYSVVTADPSPTKYWAVQWWAYDAETQMQHLVDLVRSPMDAPDFLDYNQDSRRFTGLLEEWWQRSNDQGHPFTHLIVEANAAQRFMLQYDHFKRWTAIRNVIIIPHQTNRNKSDEEYGVQTLAPHYKAGRVRFPAGDFMGSKVTMRPMVKELIHWPAGSTDDTVMAHWFLIWNAPNLFHAHMDTPPTFARPSWMSGSRWRG